MDYWIPLDKRDRSFKEYMTDFVGDQFERQLLDLGLERPWYWDIFLEDVETHRHCQAAATWAWRNTLWWNPTGNVRPRKRAWLESKYPGWNDTFGRYWDVIIENIRAGHPGKSQAIAMPAICNMCQIPISNKGGTVSQARGTSWTTRAGCTTSAAASASGSSSSSPTGTRPRTAEIARAEVLQLGRLLGAEHRAVLLLTSGLPEGAGPGGAEALVAAAKAAGAVGIVHTLAADAAQPPEAMVADVAAADLPLLSAPPDSSLRVIKDAVNERVTRKRASRYQQPLAAQSSLIAAVSTPDPTDPLLRRPGAAPYGRRSRGAAVQRCSGAVPDRPG
jgi:hypothetical protein